MQELSFGQEDLIRILKKYRLHDPMICAAPDPQCDLRSQRNGRGKACYDPAQTAAQKADGIQYRQRGKSTGADQKAGNGVSEICSTDPENGFCL